MGAAYALVRQGVVERHRVAEQKGTFRISEILSPVKYGELDCLSKIVVQSRSSGEGIGIR